MKKFLRYLIFALGIIFVYAGINAILKYDSQREYEIMFDIQVSKLSYISYKIIAGLFLIMSFFIKEKN